MQEKLIRSLAKDEEKAHGEKDLAVKTEGEVQNQGRSTTTMKVQNQGKPTIAIKGNTSLMCNAITVKEYGRVKQSTSLRRKEYTCLRKM